MAIRRGALGNLFAPAFIPGDPQSEADVAAWQAGRVGGMPNAQMNQYQVAMPRTGTTTGNPTSATTVDPALLQAVAQNQPYTPGPNVTVVPPGAPPPAATGGGGAAAMDQDAIRNEIAAQLMQQQQMAAWDNNTGRGLGSS